MSYGPEQRDFDSISSTVHGLSAALGLTIIVENADKHGSLVWEFGRSDQLNRYVTFALTETGDQPAPVIAELWVGADNGLHFTHRLVHSWQFDRKTDLNYPKLNGPRLDVIEAPITSHHRVLPLATNDGKVIAREASTAPLIFKMGWAWNVVAHMSEADLDQEFVVARVPPREEHARASGS